jgi:hypothetical protein
MSNVLEGPNPDEMKAGETYKLVYKAKQESERNYWRWKRSRMHQK